MTVRNDWRLSSIPVKSQSRIYSSNPDVAIRFPCLSIAIVRTAFLCPIRFTSWEMGISYSWEISSSEISGSSGSLSKLSEVVCGSLRGNGS
jgi:hypothetical protein